MAYHDALTLTYDEAIAVFDKCDVIALDTETNGKDVRDGSGVLYGISIAARLPSLGLCTYYFSVRHPDVGSFVSQNLAHEQFLKLKDKIENFKGFLIFHNAKFDLESLRTVGINYTGNFYCTLTIAHLLNENYPMDKSLDACTKHYLKDPGKKKSPEFNTWLALFGWEKMPSEVIREYAEYDTNLTYRLWEVLWQMVLKEGIQDYWVEHKMPYIRVVIVMERRGIGIFEDKCQRMVRIGEEQMADVVELLGGLNPGSGKDLQYLLLEKLKLPVVKRSKKTQAPSFDKEAMEQYEAMLEYRDDPTAQLILTYRGWQKAVSSCYRAYIEKRSPIDNKLHCNFKIHGTKTGRMSCSEPNLQQIPRSSEKPWNGDMKSVFRAKDGFELWEFDYSQLELRLGTAYAGEETLKAVFEEDRDIFTEMSGPLGLTRQDTKTFVYSTQYGAGLTRLMHVFGWDMETAHKQRTRYHEAYPGFFNKSKVASAKVAAFGKVKLWSGRYRHFQYPKDENHKAWNSVIQGGAADIVEETMIRLFREVDNDEECRMLLSVHDSVVFEIRKDRVEYYRPKIEYIMTHVEPDFGVKFAVEGKKFGSKG